MTAQKKYIAGMPSNTSLYDRDFYAWANEQAALASRFRSFAHEFKRLVHL